VVRLLVCHLAGRSSAACSLLVLVPLVLLVPLLLERHSVYRVRLNLIAEIVQSQCLDLTSLETTNIWRE
jgi:hypothetical protein